MRVALASCQDLPGWEVDDQPLERALRDFGVDVWCPPWDSEDIDWSIFDAVLIRTTWDYMKRSGKFLTWVEHCSTVSKLFNPGDVVRWNSNKSYLKELESQGVKLAPTMWIERGSTVSIDELLSGVDWQMGFLKPYVGATAIHTLRFDRSQRGHDQAQSLLDQQLPHCGMMLQPYMPRVEEQGELSAIYFDGSLSHSVRKIPVPGDYRVQDDFGAADFGVGLTEVQRTFADKVMSAVHAIFPKHMPLLYARIDWLTDNEGELVLNELELIEPSLFFRHSDGAGQKLANALMRRIR